MKISKHLAGHAISELLQMGYTVDGDRLNPPEKLSAFACKFFGVAPTTQAAPAGATGSYIDGVNIERLREALTFLGCHTEGQEATAANLSEHINAVTRAVLACKEMLRPTTEAAPAADHPGDKCPSCRNGDLYACTCTTKPTAQAAPAGAAVTWAAAQEHYETLADFREGQWWVNELDAMASHPIGQPIRVTPDMRRAVAVVHNLLRAATAQVAPAGATIARVVLGVDGKPASGAHLVAKGDEMDAELFDATYPHRAPHRIADLVERPTAQAAPAADALSVTNILIDIVPGLDGMGHEVYAKSVKDVEDKLSAMGQELEDWQLGIRKYAPTPAAQVDSGVREDAALPEGVIDAVAAALGEAYDCSRVWSAWSYGTMGRDDFSLVAEDGERVAEIAEAAVKAMRAAVAAKGECA